jgi:hypothetical protein
MRSMAHDGEVTRRAPGGGGPLVMLERFLFFGLWIMVMAVVC